MAPRTGRWLLPTFSFLSHSCVSNSRFFISPGGVARSGDNEGSDIYIIILIMQGTGPGGHQGGGGGHHLLPPAHEGEHHQAEDHQVSVTSETMCDENTLIAEICGILSARVPGAWT